MMITCPDSLLMEDSDWFVVKLDRLKSSLILTSDRPIKSWFSIFVSRDEPRSWKYDHDDRQMILPCDG